MPFKKDGTEETKNRIIYISEQLFSQKGYDATRVDEIAALAGINKAVIYYYFKSKEAILDYLIEALFRNISAISMDFANTLVVKMIKDGKLDIEKDRWRFASDEALNSFLQGTYQYFCELLDFALEHRLTLRIIVFESLKDGKYHNSLFRLLELLNKDDKNPVFKTIREADEDYNYSEDTVMSKFFFGFIPLINFAAYFDDYKLISALSDQQLKGLYMSNYFKTFSSRVSGRDILMYDIGAK